MIGTVIRRAATTETTGGGGTRAAPACGEQPDIAAHEQPIASARQATAFDACLSDDDMLLLPRKTE
jgi:hypothetical protein